MKKIVLLVIVALLMGGMVWAQAWPPADPNPTAPNVNLASFAGSMFDAFYAFPGVSTESRYSAGRFVSDIDNYIDVTFYDPNIGTFFFLGGFPSAATVDATNTLTSTTQVSLGLGKTFKSFYLGVYYGGHMLGAEGNKVDANPVEQYSAYAWSNNAAVLVGTHGYGAFRLDMSLNTNTNAEKAADDTIAKTRDFAPAFALTWGGIKLAGMDPYVTVGYKFPDKYTWGTNNPSKKLTLTYDSALTVQAGVNYDLNSASSLSADVVIGGIFGAKYQGDREPVGGAGSVNLKYGGAFGLGLRAGYARKIEFGKVALGFKPNVTMGYLRQNNDVSGDVSQNNPADNNLEIFAGLNMGIKFQALTKVALYSGASLQVFDWVFLNHSGGNTKDKSNEWMFNGIQWDGSAWNGGTANTLGFGMTVTPATNFVIGCGLNTILDKLFTLNLTTMQARSGTYWLDASASGNSLGALTRLFNNLTFDLTVSYKY